MKKPAHKSLNTEGLSGITTDQLPGSSKIYLAGSREDIRVPMRRIKLDPTPIKGLDGSESFEINEPLDVYDTSGPYTDPEVTIRSRKRS